MTNNLLVKAFAGLSRDAAEDHQEWPARLPGLGDPLRKVVVDPESGVLHLGAIVPDLCVPVL
jgi:hypothetical protein